MTLWSDRCERKVSSVIDRRRRPQSMTSNGSGESDVFDGILLPFVVGRRSQQRWGIQALRDWRPDRSRRYSFSGERSRSSVEIPLVVRVLYMLQIVIMLVCAHDPRSLVDETQLYSRAAPDLILRKLIFTPA